MNALLSKFQNPPSTYRSAPFWAWNSRLSPDEVERQVRDMHQQGMGGFFIHSREGLETQYMGEEWFRCIRRAVETAKSLNMKAWLYDEDRWPSGTAGGTIMEDGEDDSRYKGLTLELAQTLPEALTDAEVIYHIWAKGMDCTKYERLAAPEKFLETTLPEGEFFMILRIEICFKSEWFNDETPPDNLNAASVRLFIEKTHEKYFAHEGGEFGQTIPGIFTDEPSLADSHTHFENDRSWLPWTYDFPAYFREHRGYDIYDTLPVIFFNGEGQQKARHDFWRTVTEMYDEAYFQQIGQWCEGKGIAFTGHLLQEDKLGLGTKVNGAVMPHYRHMGIPGIDILTEQCTETITVKQCSSVVNQLGKKWMLSETYGCTGWDFTFDGQKWVGDWQFVHGVNIRCQHLALYSIAGCRKRDYPPVFNYQTAWWNKNHNMDDYFSRISLVMSEGYAVRDVLVLHPATTAWSRLGCNPYGMPSRSKDRDLPAINAYGEQFNQLLTGLSSFHYDYDLGDEIILAEKGIVDKEHYLDVGRMSYSVVILPPIDTMLRTTYDLLMKYLDLGGMVIGMSPFPTMIEGVPAPEEMKKLLKHFNFYSAQTAKEVNERLQDSKSRRVSLPNAEGQEIPSLLYLLKNCKDYYALFVVNNDRERGYSVTLSVDAYGKITQLDPLTGKSWERSSRRSDKVVFSDYFYGNESKLFIIEKKSYMSVKREETAFIPEPLKGTCISASVPKYQYSLDQPNALILDKCRWRFLDGTWSDEMDVWQAQNQIRTALGMRPVYTNGILQRYKWVNTPHPKDGIPVEFAFRFQVRDIPNKSSFLIVENAEDYSFSFNGVPISGNPVGWYLDRDFDKIPLPPFIQGENSIVIATNYLNRMEFEDCYLLGDFGVNTNREIVALPRFLVNGDWCLQGLPHFAGTVTYHTVIPVPDKISGKYFLNFEKFSASVVGVSVNGNFVGDVFTDCQKFIDITEFVRPGEIIRLDADVVGSPRNLLGPFHQREGKTMNTNASSFRCTGLKYSPEYYLHPYGLMGIIRLYQCE